MGEREQQSGAAPPAQTTDGGAEGGDRMRQMAMMARARERKQAAGQGQQDEKPGEAPAGEQQAGAEEEQKPELSLEEECQKDPIAAQKWQDVNAEASPRAMEKVPEFIEGAEKRLNETHRDKPLEAMRREVTDNGTKYLGLGIKMPTEEVVGHQGISRLLDLPGIFGFYLKDEKKAEYGSVKEFVQDAKAGEFDPYSDLKEEKDLSGRAQETWWFPTDGVEQGADLKKLREALYIQDDPNYAEGCVRLDIPPTDFEQLGFEIFKPTAFDGVMQGWGTDPWWQPSAHPNWGLTKNGTFEAVMLAHKLATFKHRTMILDGVAPAPAAANDADAAGKAEGGGNGKT